MYLVRYVSDAYRASRILCVFGSLFLLLLEALCFVYFSCYLFLRLNTIAYRASRILCVFGSLFLLLLEALCFVYFSCYLFLRLNTIIGILPYERVYFHLCQFSPQK